MDQLVLAGGGHTHALVLRKWAMYPERRPKGLITIISNKSKLIYSGMFPGVIANIYSLEKASIDIRRLANNAKVSFIKAEIVGINTETRDIYLKDRERINYTHISINVGCKTLAPKEAETSVYMDMAYIRPFDESMKYICKHDKDHENFTV